MMALRVIFVFLLALFLSGQGYAQYDISAIKVKVSSTGRIEKGRQEFQVTVNSTSGCTWAQVVLSCDGFSASKPLKPEVLRRVDNGCLINDGGPLYEQEPFVFKYVGTLPTKKFAPVDALIACSS